VQQEHNMEVDVEEEVLRTFVNWKLQTELNMEAVDVEEEILRTFVNWLQLLEQDLTTSSSLLIILISCA
jgi:hypothetical protein